jgi:two-component system chemotaxis sensor kinase CheA
VTRGGPAVAAAANVLAAQELNAPSSSDAMDMDRPSPIKRERVSELDHEDETTRQEFVAEIERMVPQLNQAVFDLEQSPDDHDLINTAFRLFHTIKGNLIMIGFPRGGETVHRVESVLDRARSGVLGLDDRVIDVLMDGVSYVEELIQRCRKGSFEDLTGETIMELTEALLPQREEVAAATLDVVDTPVELSSDAAHRANNYRKRRVPLYQCFVDFEADLQPPVLVACLIYKRLSELGDVLGTVPPLAEVEAGTMDGRFKLLLASELEPDALEARLTWLLKTHYGAKELRFTRFE